MIALLLGLAWAAEPPPQDDVGSYLDQARFFLHKSWYADAAEQLELAVATPDGALDPEAWFLLAQVRFELCDVGGARFAADRAVLHARDELQASQARDLLAFLDEGFGRVRLTSPNPGVVTRIQVERTSALLDPDLKRWLNNLSETLREPSLLPYDLWVPLGAYRVNGVDLEVVQDAVPEVTIPVRGRAPGVWQLLQLEAGLGAWVPLGETGRHELPAPTAAVSAGWPLGPLSVGVGGAFGVQTWTPRAGGLDLSAALLSVGARLGVEIPHLEPLVVRPSATVRAASLPGWELVCARGIGENYVCARDGEVHELFAYAPVQAVVPGVEIAALWHDRRRRSGLGAGVKATGEWVLGRAPSQGSVRLDDGRVGYLVPQAEDRAASYPGLSVVAVIAFNP